ncbi:alpha/beta hydrolase [Nocardioides jensenii]|uniref:alpha/beta hydrolase n=1 Tax=Nocardioides jensenii TaxID=1843 RepID=UPI0012F99B13|nr:hypothetical protein [Nocardioides jensenii]
MRLMHSAFLAPVIIATALLAGCGAGSDDEAESERTAQPTASASSATSTTPERTGLAKRCLIDVPGLKRLSLEAPDGSRLPAATFGSGTTAAVFVHQTNADGLCGWLPYASWAAENGVRVVVLDVCDYGESTCTDTFTHDVVGQLRLALDRARAAVHGGRVTLVGASMGGSLVAGAGQEAGADGIVDVSGPVEWADVPSVTRAARTITVPFLAIAATDDSSTSATELRRAVKLSPARRKKFVEAPVGHGYETLLDADEEPTPIGHQVLAWITAS